MNNKGQVLVLFVIILPVILILATYMIDSGYIVSEKSKIDDINEIVLKRALTNDLSTSEIKDLIDKNDKDIYIVDVNYDDGIRLHLQKIIEPIFGKIVGYQQYEINSNLKATYVNGKIRIEG